MGTDTEKVRLWRFPGECREVCEVCKERGIQDPGRRGEGKMYKSDNKRIEGIFQCIQIDIKKLNMSENRNQIRIEAIVNSASPDLIGGVRGSIG